MRETAQRGRRALGLCFQVFTTSPDSQKPWGGQMASSGPAERGSRKLRLLHTPRISPPRVCQKPWQLEPRPLPMLVAQLVQEGRFFQNELYQETKQNGIKAGEG